MALNEDELQAPDTSRANGTYELLHSLFIAHVAGGPDGARRAWGALRNAYPQIADLDGPPLLIHADDLARLIPAPSYVSNEYPLYMGGFNVLIGPSGAGKSFVALDMAAQVACDTSACYIAGEGIAGYAARWEAWKGHHSVNSANLWFYREALQVIQDDQLHNFIGMIQEHEPELVVIDTLARSAEGLEENSAKDVGRFVGACDRLRRALDTSILVVHHTGKAGTIRGSSALYGAADCVLSLTAEDGVITIRNSPDSGGKNKYAAPIEPMRKQIIPREPAAVLVDAENVVHDPAIELVDSQQQILEALEGYSESGLSGQAIIDATSISKATVYRQLKRLKKSGFVSYDGALYAITEDGLEALGY
jgi:RecA-family ATPase